MLNTNKVKEIKKNGIEPYFFRRRKRRVKRLNNNISILPPSIIAKVAVLTFIVTDFYCIQNLTNILYMIDSVFVFLTGLAIAIALNISPAIAAMQLSKYRNKLSDLNNATKRILLMCAGGFILAFILLFLLRASSTDVLGELITGEDKFKANLFLCFLPLITSITGFIITIATTNYEKEKVKKLQKNKLELESDINLIRQALAEINPNFTSKEDVLNSVEEHIDSVKDNNLEEKNCTAKSIEQYSLSLKQKARLIIIGNLKEQSDKREVIDQAIELNKRGNEDENV